VQAILRNESIYRELIKRASPAPASAAAQQKTIAAKQ
jgi:hypothetical protein